MKGKIAGILVVAFLFASTASVVAKAYTDPGDSEPILSSCKMMKAYTDPGDSEPLL